MSDKSNQQISNLMDGELENNASKFLLKRMASDEALSKTWENYHLIKSCLQKEKQEPLLIDVASKVCQQISGQPPVVEQIETQKFNWLKPIMGLGIAASVAFMSVFMLQNKQIESTVINTDPVIAKHTVLNPILSTSIEATVASSSKAFLPPASLSRFPSLNTGKTTRYNQAMSQSINMPYLIIINQQPQSKHLSPMRVKDISD